MTTLASKAGSVAGARSGEPVVLCQQLTKTFKDFWMRDRARAVNSVSFEIRPREVFGLLGPNGSGKSTTIKMILGLLKPTSGRVGVFGKLPTDVDIKRRIGYLPEESYLYGFLNARETLEYYAKLFELDHRTRGRRIDELLDMLGLTGAQFRPVREYSKGMQRRIGIAQALINDPDFLILDEPTTGLDPIGTRQIKDLIIELGRRGKTILLSSHLLADVEECVDRLVILYGGTIRASGTCDELLTTQNRTNIETDQLDDETIGAIDRVIRQRTQDQSGIVRVSKPRQSLEGLFLDIVERARAEQVNTSGATAGGETASFLKGDAADTAQGDALISKLLTVEPVESARESKSEASSNDGAPIESSATAGGAKPDDNVIDSLMEMYGGEAAAPKDAPSSAAPKPSPAPTAANPQPIPAAAKPVAPVQRSNAADVSLIDSLLAKDPPKDGN